MSKGLLRVFYICLGSLSLSLGILGIFLPLLPTTPLLLLTAFCYVRSSQKLYHWLLNQRFIGPIIKNYYEKKGIPRKTKIIVLSTLWLTILLSAFVFIEQWYLRLMLLAIATGVTIFILKQKTVEITSDTNEPMSIHQSYHIN